ncbi:TPA: murein transglycosylase D [Providencia stuartii]|uniref:murein transglycosylase D n=1 Tax=Providencia TaxID=586 RepID=UPI00090A1078|nr:MULTISPECIES: murein transglycosylase D [Providencia]APG51210.1 lytic transglycosylase [Providencia stuartii]AVL38851.1 murein transglycosylase D [Providencia stuartii]MBG5904868.1 murein transglycosylase D [Providencia stuartii]MBG5912603.1 murein transglycosylase D [Providencia stuartii]MBG5916045.1 murein transglycosylase D [Providencia stuartii]
MKTIATIIAIVLLAGCQSSPQQTKQNRSSANHTIETVAPHNQAASRQISTVDNDLWGYISDELKMDIPDNAIIREQASNYTKQSFLYDVTLRAEPYMYWIVDEIDNRNLPMELALIPIIESSFNPKATSPAQAAGLWQIVPITARSYGLKQDQWVDERRDLVTSTKAAFDLLENLNIMFGHDWELTLAAYNCGEGCVLNAIKKNEEAGLPTDFWSLSLPKETKQYVPKILALSQILRAPEKYQIKLPRSNRNRALTQVDVGQQITLTQAAELTGISEESLKIYNSGYKRGVTSPNGPHYIMLPTAKAEQLKVSLSDQAVLDNIRLAVAKNQHQRSTQPANNFTYKVAKGESVASIAKKFNTTSKEIKRLNGMKTATIYPGQTLKIKGSAPTANSRKTKTYRVKKGDSYYSIAKRHGIKLNDLMSWNSGVKMADLKPGVTLNLYL